MARKTIDQSQNDLSFSLKADFSREPKMFEFISFLCHSIFVRPRILREKAIPSAHGAQTTDEKLGPKSYTAYKRLTKRTEE